MSKTNDFFKSILEGGRENFGLWASSLNKGIEKTGNLIGSEDIANFGKFNKKHWEKHSQIAKQNITNPIGGVIGSILSDPTTYVPGALITKGAKGANALRRYSKLKSGAVGGGVALSSQVARDYGNDKLSKEEKAINSLIALGLGGAINAGIAGYANHSLRKNATKANQSLNTTINKNQPKASIKNTIGEQLAKLEERAQNGDMLAQGVLGRNYITQGGKKPITNKAKQINPNLADTQNTISSQNQVKGDNFVMDENKQAPYQYGEQSFQVQKWINDLSGVLNDEWTADLNKLAQLHPEMFKSEADVFRVIKEIKDNPTHFFKNYRDDVALIGKKLDNQNKAGNIGVVKETGKIMHVNKTKEKDLKRLVKRNNEMLTGTPLPATTTKGNTPPSVGGDLLQHSDDIIPHPNENINLHEIKDGQKVPFHKATSSSTMKPNYNEVEGVKQSTNNGFEYIVVKEQDGFKAYGQSGQMLGKQSSEQGLKARLNKLEWEWGADFLRDYEKLNILKQQSHYKQGGQEILGLKELDEQVMGYKNVRLNVNMAGEHPTYKEYLQRYNMDENINPNALKDEQSIINYIENSPKKGRDLPIVEPRDLSKEVILHLQKNKRKVIVERIAEPFKKALGDKFGFKFVDDIKRTISGDEISHALNRHSNANTELSRNQLPLTLQDIQEYTEIVNNADAVALATTKSNAPAIISGKQINGHYVVVEEIRTGQNELAFKTMYKVKGNLADNKMFQTERSVLSSPKASNHSATASFLPENEIIPNKAPNVNLEEAISKIQLSQETEDYIKQIKQLTNDSNYIHNKDYIHSDNFRKDIQALQEADEILFHAQGSQRAIRGKLFKTPEGMQLVLGDTNKKGVKAIYEYTSGAKIGYVNDINNIPEAILEANTKVKLYGHNLQEHINTAPKLNGIDEIKKPKEAKTHTYYQGVKDPSTNKVSFIPIVGNKKQSIDGYKLYSYKKGDIHYIAEENTGLVVGRDITEKKAMDNAKKWFKNAGTSGLADSKPLVEKERLAFLNKRFTDTQEYINKIKQEQNIVDNPSFYLKKISTSEGEQKAKNRLLYEKFLNINPIKEFGTNYAEFYHNGTDAIKKLLIEKKGQVAGAFHREDLGDIDLVWGNENFGLAHILAKRSNQWGEDKALRFISHLDENVKNGHVVELENGRVGIKTPETTIVLDKKNNNEFIITAFRDKNNKKELGNFKSVQSENYYSKDIETNAKDSPVLSQTNPNPEIIPNKAPNVNLEEARLTQQEVNANSGNIDEIDNIGHGGGNINNNGGNIGGTGNGGNGGGFAGGGAITNIAGAGSGALVGGAIAPEDEKFEYMTFGALAGLGIANSRGIAKIN